VQLKGSFTTSDVMAIIDAAGLQFDARSEVCLNMVAEYERYHSICTPADWLAFNLSSAVETLCKTWDAEQSS
jgi:hypothetical protein